MKVYEFLFEAQYDAAIASMRNKYPQSAEVIDWAKTLKKQDRVIWYLRAIEPLVKSGDIPKITELQEQLTHYLGQPISKIQQYIFDRAKNIDQTIGDLSQLEQEFQSKQNKTAPVAVKTGDRKLIEFNDGTAWWYINRAYCPDEGRSGQHCGNVVGQEKTNQRILSYRTRDGHVILTFILEPNGTLGEMKAKGNLKPADRYHPAIISLLMNPLIKGISGQGYRQDMNFSIFDLSHDQQKNLMQHKPKLVSDQVKITPLELLKAPIDIKNNPDLQQIAIKKYPSAANLFQKDSLENWSKAVQKTPSLIVYAPMDMPGYRELVLKYIMKKPEDLVKLPRAIRNDTDFLKEAVSGNSEILAYILPTTRGYDQICLAAVQQHREALRYVPKELITPEICLAAVQKNWRALLDVPKEMRTPEIFLAVVQQNGLTLDFVPKELITPEICLAAVQQDGEALRYVPKELRTFEICLAAVQQNWRGLEYVPKELITPEICLLAVQQDGWALRYVPKELRTFEICLAAVQQDGEALRYVPDNIKIDPKFKKAAGLI